ncbi:hypothetical protein [Nocardia shimofusensis]|uniref:hypothetical protein n=1 Tax=Nocardia shimofusensis TaxID=228596 RepID=UPI00083633C5|nr:hypothetical protein [Nocardia shimofusensis]
MGDYFERIVDVEVGADGAGALAEQMIDWMVSRGRLSRETSRERMYSLQVDEGYVPGPEWAQITQRWGEDWMPGPVAVIVGRFAHYPGQGEVEPSAAHCPHCRTATVIIDYPQRWKADAAVWQPFSDAIHAWQNTGAGAATCAACATTSPITSWQWADDFALGALAFDFWGWPPLTDDFVTEFGARLGHRIVHHTGKF